MFLAIKGSNLFIAYLIVIIVIAFVAIKKLIKKSNASKRKTEEKMGELNAFILQYEASKKVAADKENDDGEKGDRKTTKNNQIEDDNPSRKQLNPEQTEKQPESEQAEKQPESEQTEKQPELEQTDKPAEDEQENASENKLGAETIVRINALYYDAEMSVEQISSKTGVSVEQIEKVIG